MRMTAIRTSQAPSVDWRRRMSRTALTGVAALVCGMFGLGVVALSSPPSGAVAATTLFVDNVNGTANIGCSSAGAGACKTIRTGSAAEALSNTAVTLDVFRVVHPLQPERGDHPPRREHAPY